VIAFREPSLEAFGSKRDRVRPGDPHDVEAERLGPSREGALQRLAV
jgi:hypothetical protein